MEEITGEPAALVDRVAALDIGKATLTACVRVPHETKPGARQQEARSYATTTGSLLGLRDWLVCQGVTRVVMEATSAYWKPPFYLLEDDIAECWVVNARGVKNVPGRPKTGKLDAVWLAKLAGRAMVWPSVIPPRPQRRLRDLTRYRRTLTRERTRENQRAEKLLEDAQVKLPSVISGIFGKSGRDTLAALIAGQHDPAALAAVARGQMRARKSALQEALTGHLTEHHTFLLTMMLSRIGALTAQINTLPTRTEEAITPFAHQVAQLDEIPGTGPTAAHDLLAETGAGLSRFPTAGHLVCWAKFAPKARQSAGEEQASLHRQGQPPARRHPRRVRRSRRPHPHLPGLPLQADRQTARQATRPRRRRQLPAHHRLAPALRPRRPPHRPRPHLARPPPPPTAQTPAHRRTRTPLRHESHPATSRLTHRAL